MNSIVTFVKEAWSELRQVSWLTVPQMMASTVLVIILVIITALFIFAVDKLLQFLFALFV